MCKHIPRGGEGSQGKSLEEEHWMAGDNFRKNLRQEEASLCVGHWKDFGFTLKKIGRSHWRVLRKGGT